MEPTTSTERPGRPRETDSIRAQEARALARRRAQDLQKQRREALARAIRVGDPALVDLLLEAALKPEALPAFELLPLVEISLDERFLAHSRNVAKAGGGFLGLARISRRERKLIERIRLGILIRAGIRLGIRVQESRS